MIGAIEDAKEELKRVDHLIYVSLKYTRTVDVLLNCISRLIDAYDFMLDAILELGVETGQVFEAPSAPILKGNEVKRLYPEDQLMINNVDLYFLLRKLHRSEPQREQEYRRHVTMRTFIDGKEEIVNIDIITEHYETIKEFFQHVKGIIVSSNLVSEEDLEE